MFRYDPRSFNLDLFLIKKRAKSTRVSLLFRGKETNFSIDMELFKIASRYHSGTVFNLKNEI